MKIYYLLLLLLLTCANVYAQKQRQWLLRTGAGASFQKDYFEDNVGYSGKATGEYFISDRVSAGLSVSYSRFISNAAPYYPLGSNKHDYLPIMAVASYYPAKRLYISAGGGLLQYNYYYNNSLFSDASLIFCSGYFFNKQKKNFAVELAYTTFYKFFQDGYVSTTLSYCFWSKKKSS